MSGSFLQLLFKSQFTSGVQMKATLLVSLLSFLPGRRTYGPEARAHGLTTSGPVVAGGRRPLPVPAFAMLRRARGSPSHSRGSGPDLPQSLRRDTSKGQKGKLRNNEHLSNHS